MVSIFKVQDINTIIIHYVRCESFKNKNMDTTLLIPTMVELIKSYPWFGVVAGVITLASAVTAMTPTPKKGTPLAFAYKLIEVLALNIGKAKDTGK
jgi:hypothetical protein